MGRPPGPVASRRRVGQPEGRSAQRAGSSASATVGLTSRPWYPSSGARTMRRRSLVQVSASSGKSYLVTFNCNNDPAIFRVDLTLNQAGRTPVQQAADNTKLIPLTWNDAGHFSAVSKGSLSDWVFMATESVIDSFDSSTANWTAYRQEILAVNVVTLHIKRLAHHRSRGITVDYQTMPRVSTSWDGSLVMWASNFDSSAPKGYADLYAIPSPLGASSSPAAPTNLRVVPP